MERVAVVLRKSHAVNRFREIILRSFQAQGFSDLLLCSGFFQGRPAYNASSCFGSASPQYPCLKRVTTVGLYNAIWRSDYDAFTAGLAQLKCPCGMPLRVTKRRIKRDHWHAKVFIASDNRTPHLGIIGSSNMTSRAFGPGPQWNYEADVVLWNDSHAPSQAVMAGALEAVQDDTPFSIIVSDYAADDRLNRGLSLEQRLRQLESEIIDLSDVTE